MKPMGEDMKPVIFSRDFVYNTQIDFLYLSIVYKSPEFAI